MFDLFDVKIPYVANSWNFLTARLKRSEMKLFRKGLASLLLRDSHAHENFSLF